MSCTNSLKTFTSLPLRVRVLFFSSRAWEHESFSDTVSRNSGQGGTVEEDIYDSEEHAPAKMVSLILDRLYFHFVANAKVVDDLCVGEEKIVIESE